MKKNLFAKIATTAALMAIGGALFSFGWPVKNLDTEKMAPSFARNQRNRFNASLTFPNAQKAVAADNGKIIAVITEHQNDGDWFESPLGNAAIISHNDDLISVYANLDAKSALNLQEKFQVSDGQELGDIASSAWTENTQNGAMEFQIADTKAKTYINPLILMPRSIKPPRIYFDGVTIENQFGRSYNLATLRSVPAGPYTLYKKRQATVSPHRVKVYVNGTELEKISKEVLKWQDGKILIAGNKNYTSEQFYPSDDTELLGHVLLPHGVNTITITASDIHENSVTANYTISGY